MKRTILLIIGVMVAAVAMAQVNGSFKSLRVLNSDSTHGVIPGTIYRGSDLILRWIDEDGDVHRFFKSNGGDFWRTSGGTTITGTPVITGNVPLQFTGMNAFDITTSVLGGDGDITLNAAGDFNPTATNMLFTTSGGQTFSASGTGGVLFNNLTSFEVNTGSTGFVSIGGQSSSSLSQNDGGGNSSLLDLNAGSISMTSTGDMTFNPGGGMSLLPTFFDVNAAGAINLSTSHTGGIGLTTFTGPIQLISGDAIQLSSFTIEPDGSWNVSGNGTSGQILTSNGSSSSPTWQTPPYWLTSGTTTLTANSTISAGSNSLTFSGTSILQMSQNDGINGQALLFMNGGAISLFTNGTSRLAVETDGSWNIGGSNGTSGQVLTSNGSSTSPTWQSISLSPSGSDTQIQFNNSGAFGASADFTFNDATNVFTVGSSGADQQILINTASNTIQSLNQGSAFIITGGPGGTDGGDISVSAGAGSDNGGDVFLSGGGGTNTSGGSITIGSGGSTSGTAGNITLSTNQTGTDGSITINAGTGEVYIIISRTSCAGAPSGSLANIAGVLNICP